jgi:hypothetical protein
MRKSDSSNRTNRPWLLTVALTLGALALVVGAGVHGQPYRVQILTTGSHSKTLNSRDSSRSSLHGVVVHTIRNSGCRTPSVTARARNGRPVPSSPPFPARDVGARSLHASARATIERLFLPRTIQRPPQP